MILRARAKSQIYRVAAAQKRNWYKIHDCDAKFLKLSQAIESNFFTKARQLFLA